MKRGKLYKAYTDEPEKLEEIRINCLKFKHDGDKFQLDKDFSKAEE